MGIHTWTGTIDNKWFEVRNWDQLYVPTIYNTVHIPPTNHQPVVPSLTNATARFVLIKTGASLTVKGMFDLIDEN